MRPVGQVYPGCRDLPGLVHSHPPSRVPRGLSSVQVNFETKDDPRGKQPNGSFYGYRPDTHMEIRPCRSPVSRGGDPLLYLLLFLTVNPYVNRSFIQDFRRTVGRDTGDTGFVGIRGRWSLRCRKRKSSGKVVTPLATSLFNSLNGLRCIVHCLYRTRWRQSDLTRTPVCTFHGPSLLHTGGHGRDGWRVVYDSRTE